MVALANAARSKKPFWQDVWFSLNKSPFLAEDIVTKGVPINNSLSYRTTNHPSHEFGGVPAEGAEDSDSTEDAEAYVRIEMVTTAPCRADRR